MRPNMDFDHQGPRPVQTKVAVSWWIHNPYEHLSQMYIQVPPGVIKASGYSEADFINLYLRFIASPGKGRRWIARGAYHTLTVALRRHLARTRFYELTDEQWVLDRCGINVRPGYCILLRSHSK